MKKVKNKTSGAIIFLIIVLSVSLAGLLAFRIGVIDISGLKKAPAYEKDLVKAVAFRGAIKAKDLNLSQSEVRYINNTVLKHSNTFTGINLELNVWDTAWPIKIQMGTILDCAIVLDIDQDCQVQSWTCKITRHELVPHMVRYIERCAAELKRYDSIPELKKTPEMKGFKRIYM